MHLHAHQQREPSHPSHADLCHRPTLEAGARSLRPIIQPPARSEQYVHMSENATSKRNQQSVVGIVAAIAIGAALAVAGSQGSDDAGGIAVFAIGAIVAFGVNLVVFVPSVIQQTEKYYDATGSLTYLTVTAIVLLLSHDPDARAIVVAIVVAVWAARLGTFLFARIKRDGSDGRFDEIRQNVLRFLMTWMLQGLWVFLTSAAALAIITSSEREGFDVFAIVGILMWLIGMSIEVTADQQKASFKADSSNDGRFISTGIWAWSRHPNYFGEIVLWTGVAVMALPILSGWRFAVLISPAFVYLLLTRISGVPMLERRADKRWGDEPEYQEYKQRTPVLVPRPPR